MKFRELFFYADYPQKRDEKKLKIKEIKALTNILNAGHRDSDTINTAHEKLRELIKTL